MHIKYKNPISIERTQISSAIYHLKTFLKNKI